MKKRLYGCTLFFFLLPMVLNFSCSNSPQSPTHVAADTEKKIAIRQKPPSSFSDTITIGFPAAVFYNADSLQLLKIKSITDKGIFESTMHECFYQMRYSRIVLKKEYPHIKIVEVKNARFLSFIKTDGKKEWIDLNKNNNSCGLYIFNAKDSPIPVDMTNVETGLGFYFTK